MAIEHVIKIFTSKIASTKENLEDNELIAFLMERGTSKETSVYATLFIPIIFGRIVCESLHVNFVDSYYEHLEDGSEREGIFTENYFYVESYKSISAIIQSGMINQDEVLKIALRSPEFKLLNDFLKKGNNANNIQFSPLHIVW